MIHMLKRLSDVCIFQKQQSLFIVTNLLKSLAERNVTSVHTVVKADSLSEGNLEASPQLLTTAQSTAGTALWVWRWILGDTGRQQNTGDLQQ